ncbi:MAG: putative transcriptional regulator [uncultured archaeon A07HR60]|nr:MAG: putative transcriptional regulator [uncultured archaeon A07HR60]
MKASLEQIEFLARSKNRVELLRLLADDTHTRRSLAAATGASQATLGRILEDFTDRSWVAQEGSDYTATATGEMIADGVSDLMSILETEAKLRDVVVHLPTAELEFDLRCLADATITVPSRTRPSAPLQQVLDAMEAATTLQAFSHTLNEQSLATVRDCVVDGGQTFETVLSEGAVQALKTDDLLWTKLLTLSANPRADIKVLTQDIPLAVVVADETVYLLVRDDEGLLRAALHTDDSAVQDWAATRFDHYHATAEPFDPASFEA